MDYKFTFSDGSDAYLSHHGVKGMKWGKWNAETAARYAAAGQTASEGGGGVNLDQNDLVSDIQQKMFDRVYIDRTINYGSKSAEQVAQPAPNTMRIYVSDRKTGNSATYDKAVNKGKNLVGKVLEGLSSKNVVKTITSTNAGTYKTMAIYPDSVKDIADGKVKRTSKSYH